MRHHIILIALAAMLAVPSALKASDRVVTKVYPVAPHTAYAPAVDNGFVEVELPENTAAGDCSVKCVLKYDDTKFRPSRVEARTVAKRVAQSGTPGLKEVTLSVAPGTYDFHVVFCAYDPELPASQWDFYNPEYHVFKELVNVTGDMEMELDMSTATNFVKFEPVTPEGEPFKHQVLMFTESGNSYFDYSDANIVFETLSLTISNSLYGELSTRYGTGNHRRDDGRSTLNSFNLYVNDVSDRYTFTQCRIAVNPNNDLFLVTMAGKAQSASTTVSNAGKGYETFSEDFQVSPIYDKLRRDLYESGIYVSVNVNNLQVLNFDHLSADKLPVAHFSWAGGDLLDNVEYSITPRIYEMDAEIADSDQRAQLKMYGCTVAVEADKKTYVNAVNPYFAYPYENVPGTIGDNVPVSCVIMHAIDDSSGNRQILYAPSFVGRYGERRETDLYLLEAEISYNGTPVCSSFADIQGWAAAWSVDGHEPGVMTARFTNSNVVVGGVPGKSVTETTYKEGQNDMCAPAVQMLAFSDKTGRLTDRFAAGSEIVVEVAAGDANGNGLRYSYMDAKEVKLEYAPYGSDKFVAVPLKYIKGAISTASWSVYGGSISSPTGSSNGWYDVRISVVDNENNRSVQTISPAFKVYDASTGIEELPGDSGVSVYCDGTVLHVQGVENPEVEVYAVGGYRVLSATGNEIDLSAVASGVYFVRLGNETYKIVVRP